MSKIPPFYQNCPVNEQTADGTCCGRCWHYLPDGKTCPRHGDVSLAVEHYKRTGRTMKEDDLKAAREIAAELPELIAESHKRDGEQWEEHRGDGR